MADRQGVTSALYVADVPLLLKEVPDERNTNMLDDDSEDNDEKAEEREMPYLVKDMFVEQGWPLYKEVVRRTVIHTVVPVHRDTVDAEASLVVLREKLRAIAMPVVEKYKHCRGMALW